VLASRGLTRRQLEQNASTATAQPPQRVKGETADEKRARKQAVRDVRKVRDWILTQSAATLIAFSQSHQQQRLLTTRGLAFANACDKTWAENPQLWWGKPGFR